MNRLTAILIDDERNSREALHKKILTHCSNVNVVAQCANGEEGLAAIAAHKPDIVFLDIEMPRMNGFTMLQQLPEQSFELIFTTAFNQYAIQAIRFAALDYLVKPVDVQELINAVARVQEKRLHSFTAKQLAILADHFAGSRQKPDKIAVSTAAGLEIIELDGIVYLEATGNYTHIHLKEGKPLLASKTLKEFEDMLPADRFFRIHNASLLNVAYIKKYNKGEGGQVVLHNGVVLDVARRRKDELLQLIQSFASRI
jgi:two-component system LytT family response regulator